MCNLYLCNPMSFSHKKAKEQMDNIMKLQGDGWLYIGHIWSLSSSQTGLQQST